MDVTGFYKDHWTDYPLDIQGVIPHLRDLFPDGVEGKRVLDGGSGSGMVSLGFAALGADVTGVDITPKCVENGIRRAESLGLSCRFLEGDLTRLDLGETFDIVYSWGVIHHSADARAAFRCLANHLSPDGEMVLAVYLKTRLSGFWNFTRRFYRGSPAPLQTAFRRTGSVFLNGVDVVKGRLAGRPRYMMRGTRNEELINDWFGVPQRTFHTYDEVFGWFREAGLEPHLWNEATGRFRSTSNFVVRSLTA